MKTHHEVAQLLPWFVNGTLNEAEFAAVEHHLTGCAECREAVRRDVEESRWAETSADIARVAALTARRHREFEGVRRRLAMAGHRRAPRVSRFALAALAAAVAAALALPTLWLGRDAQPKVYELRTTRTVADTPVLQVIFRDGTSNEDIDLLIRASGKLLGAPSVQGVYRIALANDDQQALLQRIRAHPAVRWAEIEL